MGTQLDHLVVVADNLQQGVDYIRQKLGITMPFGGEHPQMGTHNHLMQLGNDVFLEVIAVNPGAQPPERPRWFGLDDPVVRDSLKAGPRLMTWVVNCKNIDELMSNASCSFGRPELITRGELSWRFGLPADGRLLGSGLLPYLIQWHVDEHPAKNMADVGVKLDFLELHHPNAHWLKQVLASIGADDLVKVSEATVDEGPQLKALFTTPSGQRELVG